MLMSLVMSDVVRLECAIGRESVSLWRHGTRDSGWMTGAISVVTAPLAARQ